MPFDTHRRKRVNTGFSLTFEVEGHWLVSREVPCETEGRRPETVGGSGGMLPRKIFRTQVSQECIFQQCGKEIFVLLSLIPNLVMVKTNGTLACLGEFVYSTTPL